MEEIWYEIWILEGRPKKSWQLGSFLGGGDFESHETQEWVPEHFTRRVYNVALYSTGEA